MNAKVMNWMDGNPGAMNFLMMLCEDGDSGIKSLEALESLNIRGTDLYVLYSDLCGRDMNKVHNLIRDCPKEVLEDACSRQDYSGRELVESYL